MEFTSGGPQGGGGVGSSGKFARGAALVGARLRRAAGAPTARLRLLEAWPEGVADHACPRLKRSEKREPGCVPSSGVPHLVECTGWSLPFVLPF